MVAVLLILGGSLLIGGADLGDDVEVGPELEGLVEGIRDQPPAVEAQLHGLVNVPAHGDQVVLGNLGRVLFSAL